MNSEHKPSVSEELSSVETLLLLLNSHHPLLFQKNLVVWKPIPFDTPSLILFTFQKNLVVWKLFCPRHERVEGVKFQKNLVVWKRYKFPWIDFLHFFWFQKNLVVWKQIKIIE